MVEIPCFWKKNEIKRIIAEHRPQILQISELNLGANIDFKETFINGYTLEIDQQISNLKMARSGVYIHNSLSYLREIKNEEKLNSIICIKVGYPGKKKSSFIATIGNGDM